MPEGDEVTGLLALMLLTHARREARTTPGGDLVPLAEQDRKRWDRALIDEGLALTRAALAGPALGPYQLQAAIAATHAAAIGAPLRRAEARRAGSDAAPGMPGTPCAGATVRRQACRGPFSSESAGPRRR
ncbi:hypothetical protein GQF42_05295 [Streptomyces broussonetiae]|uniref:DUF6596 domain-containing protein n=1 Tax=Streptomyces broussonetiae TaxID=2686304 RepID=A0A6I6N3D5_9ACTN|nr:hypothetical protein GQF42_05295 [Streptomyces broussonetiae]